MSSVATGDKKREAIDLLRHVLQATILITPGVGNIVQTHYRTDYVALKGLSRDVSENPAGPPVSREMCVSCKAYW
jgi:hypothetical protein